jgi:hypothetical protein
VCAAHAWAQDTNWRNNRQARTVVNRLITNTNSFRREIQRTRYPWDNNTTSEERLSDMISAFSNSLTSLRSSLNTNSNAKDEVDGVLSRASRINMFLDRNRVTSRAQSRWTSIRTDVNTLAGYYNIAWNWNTPYPSGGVPGGGYGTRGSLTGTYRLDTRLSDNITTVVDRSVRLYAANQRDRVRRALERRLSSPDMIVIDRNGRTITMASSLQPQVTFEADGVAKSETNPRGRTVTTTVSQTANGFTVNYAGDRMNDFTVSFDVDRDGRLRVERRIYLENRNDTVTATSVYDRVNGIAQWSAITPQTTGPWYNNTGSTGQFYIPNGITLTARLRNTVNTRASQVGDLFTMDVTSPNEFRGSVIRGHVSETSRSGRLSGRANMQLDFDTITVNGREYAFAGMIDSVTAANGDSVSVNNEGTIRDNNQTTKTVTRAGIGAVLGAVIGAIAGGGEGAAIGAGVGAGAGAGSVLVGGRDNIELGTGSTFTITASAPANAAFIRRN